MGLHLLAAAGMGQPGFLTEFTILNLELPKYS